MEEADLPAPEPGAGEVRLRVRACGLCHTDLHTVEGDLPLPKLPVIPGHQIVGVVDATGAGARRFKEGDRVGVPWLHWTCGSCEACRRGDENLCDRARFTGYHVDGGYAEIAMVPEDFALPLPRSFHDQAAAPLLCAGIIGYRALKLSDLRPGERLGLFGFGASASIAIQVARHWQCQVWVFTRASEHRALAGKLGATWVGGAEGWGAEGGAGAGSRGAEGGAGAGSRGAEGGAGADDEPPGLLDRAISFAPAGALIPAALRKLRKGGTLALAGIHIDRIPEMDYSLIYGERTLRSVTASTRKDAEELLALAELIPIRTEVETFPLAQANLALQRLKASRLSAAGVLTIE